jgi:hypothetical protein
MDNRRFDALVRVVSRTATRRGALAALLGMAIAGRDAVELRARRKQRARRKHRAGNVNTEAVSRCYPSKSCVPGPGRIASRCDFSSADLRNLNAGGANLSNSNFTDADLRGAYFGGANLSGACFVGADLTGATLGASVNLRRAVFCDTIMPDGSTDDSGCDRGTTCCPTCRPATCESLGLECGAWPDGCGGALECGVCPPGATPACDDGMCVSCDALCSCGDCLTFATGDTECIIADFGECTEPCASNADCTNPNLPACVVSITDRVTNETTTVADLCGPPVTVGICSAPDACGP